MGALAAHDRLAGRRRRFCFRAKAGDGIIMRAFAPFGPPGLGRLASFLWAFASLTV